MKITIIFLCLFASLYFVNAQDASDSEFAMNNNHYDIHDDDSQWLQNRIGVYGSFFSGYGLSYQYQFESGFSFRTQLFAFGRKNDNSDYNTDEIRLAYGADLQYNLRRSDKTRLYALVGSFLDYYKSGGNYYHPSTSTNYDIEQYFNIGGGFGIELMAWRNISFVIEGGYYGRFGNNRITDYKIVNGQEVYFTKNQSPKTFGFGVGGGISYAF